VTGQVQLDSYADTGVYVAIDLVNELAVASPDDPVAVVRRVLAIDPPSLGQFVPADALGFGALAADLHTVFDLVRVGRLDSVAALLNHMLATYPSHPHLALEDGVWRLHHHPVDAELIPMWTAICAEALARLIGNGHAQRLGTCERPGCGRVFVDVTKNASRAFCSTTCQNRVKAAAFRARRDPPAQAVEASHSANVGPPSRASAPGSIPPSS
jgi:CGNR zinc finger